MKRGQTMTEYALILFAFIAIGVGGWQAFGNQTAAVSVKVDRELIPPTAPRTPRR